METTPPTPPNPPHLAELIDALLTELRLFRLRVAPVPRKRKKTPEATPEKIRERMIDRIIKKGGTATLWDLSGACRTSQLRREVLEAMIRDGLVKISQSPDRPKRGPTPTIVTLVQA